MSEEQNKATEAEKNDKDKTAAENAAEAAEEVSEVKASAEETKADESEPEQSENVPETASDDTAELEELRAENIRLKAQLEAHSAGFGSEYIEDAVLIAENVAKRDGLTISEALQAVAKKYPDWRSDGKDSSKGKGGFKVGADTPKEPNADDESLDRAFGLRRKK